MRKILSFFAFVAIVLTFAACGGKDGNNPVISGGNGNTPEQPKPVGAIKGKFSVAADKQVYFSKGNLQATTENKGESWTWSFATNQWDFVGNQVANNAIGGNGKVSANGSVDLFIWSISDQYYGIHVQENHFAPLVDWGNNPISNGGNQPNLWRTMTQSEWEYLFQTRKDAANKYGAAKVNDILGYVLLPDEWTFPSGLVYSRKDCSDGSG